MYLNNTLSLMIAASFGLMIPMAASATPQSSQTTGEKTALSTQPEPSRRIQITVTELEPATVDEEAMYLADSGDTSASDEAPGDEAPATPEAQEIDDDRDAAELDAVEVEYDETEMDALEYDIIQSEEFQNPSATDSD